MSSLKRRVGPGGCDETESSEAEHETSPAPNKKARSFMLPRHGGTPFVSSSMLSRSKSSAPEQVQTNTSTIQQPKDGTASLVPPEQRGDSSKALEKGSVVTLTNASRGSLSLRETLAASKQKQNSANMEESSDETSRPPTAGTRTRVQFERRLNEIHTNLETFKADVNGRLARIEGFQANSKKQQDLILVKLNEVLDRFERSNFNLNLVPSTSNATIVLNGGKPTCTDMNPKANPLLHEVCYTISRGGAIGKEFGKFEAPIKSYVRRGICLALRVEDFKRPPLFYSNNGAPDFFPEVLREESGYCQPYPHWDSSFASNYPCIPTLVLFVRSMFANDNTPTGEAARALTDDQIISLIYHGPFKTLKNNFNTAKTASPDDPDIQSAGKRGVSRLEEKFFHRRLYRPQIIVMLERSWDGSWYKLVMSPEVSDGSGGFVIKRPIWRAGWFNNLMTALDNARRTIQLAKNARCIRGKRTIEYVEGPPPLLRSSEGELVKIPLCMISKEWRMNNQAWMEAMPHLIDTSLSKKPDVLAFINANPAPVEPRDDEGEGPGNEGGEGWGYEGEGEGSRSGDRDGDGDKDGDGDGDGKGDGKGEGKAPGEDEEDGQWEGWGYEGEDMENGRGAGLGSQRPLHCVLATTGEQLQEEGIPIDPSLPTSPKPQTRSLPRPRIRPPPTVSLATLGESSSLADSPSAPWAQVMPWDPSAPLPPPPLLLDQNTTLLAVNEAQQTEDTLLTGTQDDPSSSDVPTGLGQVPVKRGRGRPRGSRGKKTIARLATESAATAAGKQV